VSAANGERKGVEANVTASGAVSTERERANAIALERLVTARPMLTDVAVAVDVVPGMDERTILTSGTPLEWDEYRGGQRRSVLNAALFEGLASSHDDAEAAIRRGDIRVRSTQDHSCVGSVAGIYTASMPVLVVDEATYGGRAFCNLYEGKSPLRLNYGAYGPEVIASLRWLADVMMPVLSAALATTGPLDLKAIMARALRLGDELHSRNTAATMLFEREIRGALCAMSGTPLASASDEVVTFLRENDYTFLRMGMAAAKAIADAAHGVPGSSIVSGMVIDCNNFAIRVSGLGSRWFRGEHPTLEGRFFEGFGPQDAEWIGGESCFTEVVGLGGFAQSCAPTLQAYQGGDYLTMIRTNEEMYQIAIGEHPDFLLPPLAFRGSPVGIDIFRVLETGLTPAIDGGLAGRDGGQIGAGVLRPQLDCFEAAATAFRGTYQE
jgi:hypothetical protein